MRNIRAILCTGFIAIGAISFAAGPDQPAWTETTISKVKPELRAQYETYLKQVIATHQKAGATYFLTFTTFAGDTTEYTTVVPVTRFADLDGPPVAAKIMGETAWNRLSRNMARCYTAQIRQYATPQNELEINRTETPAADYWLETRMQLAPGKLGDYLKWIANDYRPAIGKAGVSHFQVSQPIFGTATGEVITLRMLKNLAEIDAGALLSQVLSDDEARAMGAKSSALVSGSTTRILRLRRDLTYRTGP